MGRVLCSMFLSLVACGDKRATPPVAESTPAPADARVAIADAAVVVTVDAAPAKPLVGKTVPEFGCLGWSPTTRVAACVVGQRGFNIGGVDVQLKFISATAGAAVPAAIPILTGDVDGLGPDELPPALASRLAAALKGFIAFERAPQLVFANGDLERATTTVAGLAIALRTESAKPVGMAPCYRAVVTAGGHTASDLTDPISHLDVRGFALGEGVLVEHVHSVGDEGVSGTYAKVSICTPKGCSDRP